MSNHRCLLLKEIENTKVVVIAVLLYINQQVVAQIQKRIDYLYSNSHVKCAESAMMFFFCVSN
jgi:hypothetical protein